MRREPRAPRPLPRRFRAHGEMSTHNVTGRGCVSPERSPRARASSAAPPRPRGDDRFLDFPESTPREPASDVSIPSASLVLPRDAPNDGLRDATAHRAGVDRPRARARSARARPRARARSTRPAARRPRATRPRSGRTARARRGRPRAPRGARPRSRRRRSRRCSRTPDARRRSRRRLRPSARARTASAPRPSSRLGSASTAAARTSPAG